MQLSWPRQHFFLLKERIKNPDLFRQSTRIRHSVFFFPEEWIAKFNLSHGNRHDYDYDYDYDYAAASLPPKSRLNFQLLVI